jgi:Flp pilus assembly protein TadD
MAQEEYSSAADILRMLVLAAPAEPDVWNALAACHDAAGRTDIGETLRSLSWLVQLQTSTRSS